MDGGGKEEQWPPPCTARVCFCGWARQVFKDSGDQACCLHPREASDPGGSSSELSMLGRGSAAMWQVAEGQIKLFAIRSCCR